SPASPRRARGRGAARRRCPRRPGGAGPGRARGRPWRRSGAMQHPHPEPSRVEAVLRALSLEAQVGQVFMVGFPGTQPPEPFLARVATGEVGNVVLFARNFTTPDGARAMIRRLQAAALAASLPGLLISTDQEGGSVIRLRRGATWFPSRSEEHTSELQSRENLVCRLLLEKKKKKRIENTDQLA